MSVGWSLKECGYGPQDALYPLELGRLKAKTTEPCDGFRRLSMALKM